MTKSIEKDTELLDYENYIKKVTKKLNKSTIKKIKDVENFDIYWRELEAKNELYDDEIAKYWRERFIKPFNNFPFKEKSNYIIFSSNPQQFNNNIDNIHPELKEGYSLEEKITKIYGPQYSKLYLSFIGKKDLENFRMDIYDEIKYQN